MHINNMDAIGVSMAAIQGLYEQNQELEAENASQQEQIDSLQRQNAGLDARLEAVEAALSGDAAPPSPSQASTMPWAGLLLGAVGLIWVSRQRRVPSHLSGGDR